MSDTVSPRYDWVFDNVNADFSKEKIMKLYVSKILTRTQKMFKYGNLPKTIPQKDLELILQCSGAATITKVGDDLYAFRGELGGKPNPYYLPTLSIVANPALKFNASLKIDEECVVIRNDALYQGLMPLIRHNAYLLAECDISFKFAAINSRIPALIDAPDDNTKAEAEKFFKDIEDGKKLGAIASKAFLDKISVYDYANKSTNITNLIELKQYIIGTFFQDIGIQSQFNMKREAINEAEAALSTDILYPLVDDMLRCRKEGVEKVNKKYGTNITVELDSVWKQLRVQQDLAINLQKAEIKKEGNVDGTKQENNNETNS